ncbi:MAG: hypothetical protein VXZ82_19415 [Planctomycetota bacterium]|nr:hypothetical protein [Planctomycetota bacterium]
MATNCTNQNRALWRSRLACFLPLAAFCILPAFALSQDSASVLATVEPKSGPSFQGTFSGSQDDKLVFEQDGNIRTFAVEDISRIQFAEESLATAAKYQLRLRDGGSWRCKELSSDGQQITIDSASSQNTVNTKLIDSVQLNELTPEQEKSWKEYLASELSADILVVRQGSGQLTKIEGIVLAIENAAVQFEFSGQTVPVPFERLVGLRFFNSQSPEKSPEVGVLRDSSGSSFRITSIRRTAEDTRHFSVNLVGGGSVEFKLTELLDIHFAGQPTLFLADLRPTRQTGTSSFAFSSQALERARSQLVHRIPKRSIPGREIGPGLEFRGVGEAVFETPKDFRKLVGSVGLAPTGDRYTDCRVEVYSEKKLLWKHELIESGSLQSFEIPVVAGERLRIVVSSESKLQTGILVRWQQPFFTN